MLKDEIKKGVNITFYGNNSGKKPVRILPITA
jgi:hypothetical protein